MDKPRTILSAAVFSAVVGVTLGAATAARAQDCPGHPDAIGTSRVLTIDPSEYQRLGTLQYHQTLPLDDHEVVLTFDDGPIAPYSNQILDILASQCVKATFFLVGEMAKAYPAVVRRIHDEGHTIGSHSQDHPLRFDRISDEKVRWEIDAGIDNVSAALGDGGGLAPFFRIPGFGRTDVVESELAARSLVVFSTDVVADDWHRRIAPSQIIARAMSRLEAKGKGMLLLHDIHPWTVAALPGLLKALKDKGFRVVQVVPSATMAPGPIAERSIWTVAWSMAGQTVMDDSGNGPAWPKLTDSPVAETADLPAPDEGAFDPRYALARAREHGRHRNRLAVDRSRHRNLAVALPGLGGAALLRRATPGAEPARHRLAGAGTSGRRRGARATAERGNDMARTSGASRAMAARGTPVSASLATRARIRPPASTPSLSRR